MANRKKILNLIEQAARKHSTELDLSNNQLTILPPEIAYLDHLSASRSP